MKKGIIASLICIVGLCIAAIYSFGQNNDGSGDNSPNCCCYVFESAQRDYVDYIITSKEACIAQGDSCVADSYCKE